MQKRNGRVKRDPERFLPPFGAIVIPLFVFTVLVIVTSYRPADVRMFRLDLAREDDPVEPLEEKPDAPEEEPVDLQTDMCPVELTVDMPSVEEVVRPQPPVPVEAVTPFRPDVVAQIQSPRTMMSVAAGVRGQTGRAASLRRFGGDARAEAAVLRALRWIKLRQREDGSWDAEGEGDATAFALLAYLSHGESMTSPEFGGTVKRAIAYLAEHHPNNMSVYALAEAANVVKTPVLKEIAEEAVEELCQRQKESVKANSGGLLQRYCAVMALKSAELAGLSCPSRERTQCMFEKAFADMRDGKASNWNKIKGKGTWHYMVAGVCLQYLGRGDDPTTGGMLKRLDEVWPPATLGTTAIACCPVRSNYFSTMIFFNAGGPLWEKWNRGMLAAYASSQQIQDEGYVDQAGKAQPTGCWRCQDQHIGDQPFWTTCYIAHQLMVYYRYLPTYTKEAWGTGEQSRLPLLMPPKNWIDVSIDI